MNAPTQPVTEAILDQIVKDFTETKTPFSHICKKYHVNKGMALRGLRRRGVQPRGRYKYDYNETFFEKINTEEKAYVLGFFYADGCTSVSRQHVSKISLAKTDEEMVKRIGSLLAPDKPLQIAPPRYAHRQLMISLSVTNEKITQDLIKAGCMPKKSAILKFPTPEQVPAGLLSHFIRGYFDGDGSLYFHLVKNGGYLKAQVHIESSRAFCESLSLKLLELVGVTSKIRSRKKTSTSRGVRISGNRQVIKFMRYVYEGSTIRLQRKHEKYLEFLATYNERAINRPLVLP